MDTSIRNLKAHLSEYLQRVEAGDTIVVKNRSRVVARIIPHQATPLIERLQRIAGVSWNGNKPKGMKSARAITGKKQIAGMVIEDRR